MQDSTGATLRFKDTQPLQCREQHLGLVTVSFRPKPDRSRQKDVPQRAEGLLKPCRAPPSASKCPGPRNHLFPSPVQNGISSWLPTDGRIRSLKEVARTRAVFRSSALRWVTLITAAELLDTAPGTWTSVHPSQSSKGRTTLKSTSMGPSWDIHSSITSCHDNNAVHNKRLILSLPPWVGLLHCRIEQRVCHRPRSHAAIRYT